MTVGVVLNSIYPILAIIAAIMVAHYNRNGWLLFLAVEVLVIGIGVRSGQWGVVVMGVVYIFIHLYTYWQWGKARGRI